MAKALGPSLWVVEPENGLFGKPYEYAKAAQKTCVRFVAILILRNYYNSEMAEEVCK